MGTPRRIPEASPKEYGMDTGIAQRTAHEGGEPPVVCGVCGACFYGPERDKWFLAHRAGSHGTIIIVR